MGEPVHGQVGSWGSIFKDLLGPPGCERPTVWAECISFDPITDIAVLTMPDSQALYGQADAYDELVDSTEPFALGTFEASSDAHMLALDTDKLITGEAERCGMMVSVTNCDGYIRDGMSGSPIVTPEGVASASSPVVESVLSLARKPDRTRCWP